MPAHWPFLSHKYTVGHFLPSMQCIQCTTRCQGSDPCKEIEHIHVEITFLNCIIL
ncbi:unnamed protein product [Ixodes pacificus]